MLATAALCLGAGPAALAQDLVVTGGAVAHVAAPSTYASVSVADGGVLLVNAPLTVTGDMTVGPGGLVTMDAGVTTLSLDVGGTLAVELGGAIDVAALGLPAGESVDPLTGARTPRAGSGGASHCVPGDRSAGASAYDDPFDPRFPGAGGEGGAGGGALIVRAGRLRLDGVLRSNGGASGRYVGGGAGGALNLDVSTLSGGGALWARGTENGSGPDGAGGCVRILATSSSFTGTIDVSASSAAPGSALFIDRGTTAVTLAAGTLELRGGHRLRSLAVASGATLRLAGAAQVDAPVPVPLEATVVVAAPVGLQSLELGPAIAGTVHVVAATSSRTPWTLTGRLVLDERLVLPSLEVLPGASVTHSPGVRTFHLDVAGRLHVAAGARIDATGLGLGSDRSIDPLSGLERDGSGSTNGGSHGGLGGRPNAATPLAATYDLAADPRFPGGGGGTTVNSEGGSGGGVLRVTAGLLELDGVLIADGAPTRASAGGSGAGGTIALRAGTLAGAGAIMARGAPDQGSSSGGGGGGGLVRLTLGASTFSGVVSVAGGVTANPGAPGVVTQTLEPMAPRIASVPPAGATPGSPYVYVPRAGGTPPFAWRLGSGPAGASVDPASGALLWTAPASGEADFTLVVSNAYGEDAQAFRVAVREAPADAGPFAGPAARRLAVGCGCGPSGAQAPLEASLGALLSAGALVLARATARRRRRTKRRAGLSSLGLCLALALLSRSALAQVLVVDASNSPYALPDGGVFERVTVKAGGVLEGGGRVETSGDFEVKGLGLVTLSPGRHKLELQVGQTFRVESQGAVDLAGKGYAAGLAADPLTGEPVVSTGGQIGGTHCGRGGGPSAPVNDNPIDPRWPGSGGGVGFGGGALVVTAARATVEGSLRADGESVRTQNAGGGSGGTLNLLAETFEGGGHLSATGGASTGGFG